MREGFIAESADRDLGIADVNGEKKTHNGGAETRRRGDAANRLVCPRVSVSPCPRVILQACYLLQFPHRLRRLVERRLLLRCKLQLNDFFKTLCAELGRNAHVDIL